jgi:hypothetical protein
MPRRSLSRLNDQAITTLSAIECGSAQRIGFLVMPPTSCVDVMCGRRFASRDAADRGQRIAGLLGKIKIGAHDYNIKATKRGRLPGTSQQSYRCVVEIVTLPSFNKPIPPPGRLGFMRAAPALGIGAGPLA